MTHCQRAHRSAVTGWRNLCAQLVALVILCAPALTGAQMRWGNVSLDGFGTLGWVHSSEEQADFVGGLLQPSGAGHTASWSADVDSRLGLQLSAELTPRLTGVLQVVSEQRHDGSFTPQVEWANLKFQVTPEFDLRIGRTVLGTFLVSDHRKVAFANPWVRPPVELYRLVPVSSADGIDVGYTREWGEVTHNLQAYYGQSGADLPQGGEFTLDRAFGFSDSAQWGAATFRVSYQQAAITVTPFNTLFDNFRRFGPPGIALAERYDVDRAFTRFVGVAASYDPGDWFVMGEWGHRHGHSALGKRTSWYTSGGYRLGRFTPYATFASTRANSARSDPGLPVSSYPPALAATLTMLNATLNRALALNPVQQTSSIGVRWDFRDDVSLKLQYDHTELRDGSHGVLFNLQPGFEAGRSFDLLNVAVDFVF